MSRSLRLLRRLASHLVHLRFRAFFRELRRGRPGGEICAHYLAACGL